MRVITENNDGITKLLFFFFIWQNNMNIPCVENNIEQNN